MNKRGRFGSMEERVARRASPADAPPPTGGARATSDGVLVKHCWVNGTHGRLPGLLLEWQQRAGGWRGRVVHPVRDDEGWLVVEEWLPAEILEPVEGEPRP
jgi:hypothetical protein